MKAKSCIWIIDDDKHDIELMESVIIQYMKDINILSFENSEAVLEEMKHMREGRFDNTRFPGLIILDLKMPVRDGCEVFRMLRAEKYMATTPVVIFSSSGMESDIRKCYNLGVNAFVSKPVHLEDFERTLHSMLDFWLKTCEVTEGHQLQ